MWSRDSLCGRHKMLGAQLIALSAPQDCLWQPAKWTPTSSLATESSKRRAATLLSSDVFWLHTLKARPYSYKHRTGRISARPGASHHRLEDQTQVAAVVEVAEQADDVALAVRVQAAQLPQDDLLGLPRLVPAAPGHLPGEREASRRQAHGSIQARAVSGNKISLYHTLECDVLDHSCRVTRIYAG